MQIYHAYTAANFPQNSSPTQLGRAEASGEAEAQQQARIRDDSSDAEEKKVSLAELAETFAKMLENVRDGRPADKDKEESQRDAGLNEYKNAKENGKSSPEETESHAGMNRIRTTLGAAGFEREDIDAYVQAMKMPETNGTSREATDLQQEQQEQLLEEQKQEQQIENRLTEPQQLSSSMTYQKTEMVDEIEKMKGMLPTV